MLNLGCGARHHPAWTNVDIAPRAPSVLQHDLSQPLPFAEASFVAVYHSHVLEHLPPEGGRRLLAECFRVLKPGGVIRVAVPDLETIARLYLENLERAAKGDAEAARRYDWIVLELLDQLTRDRSGGEMGRYWRQNPMPCEDFVFERMGDEVRGVVEQIRSAPPDSSKRAKTPTAEQSAAFHASGEVHQWMYDRHSLGRRLSETGFADTCVCTATESRIPKFAEFELDTDATGRVRKPDSLFMEAVKP